MKIMKTIKLILTGMFLSAPLLISAQEEVISIPRFRLGIEAGIMSAPYASTNKPANIRENRSYSSSYDYDYYCGFLPEGQDFTLYYFGLKLEYALTKRFAVAAGLRFSFNPSSLDSDRDYFLWKTSEDGVNTNYVKITDVSQKNMFVGIPLEVKFFPREIDYFVRHYFILGTTLNFLVSSKNEISYGNNKMEKYDALISEQIVKPNIFHGYLYAGFGLKIGHSSRPLGNIEMHFPVYMFDNKRLSSFARAKKTFGIGIQTTLQIPLFKKYKLKY
jgi:hypothetical protein